MNSYVVSRKMHIQPGLVYISHTKGKKPLRRYLTPPESVQVIVAFVLDPAPQLFFLLSPLLLLCLCQIFHEHLQLKKVM